MMRTPDIASQDTCVVHAPCVSPPAVFGYGMSTCCQDTAYRYGLLAPSPHTGISHQAGALERRCNPLQ